MTICIILFWKPIIQWHKHKKISQQINNTANLHGIMQIKHRCIKTSLMTWWKIQTIHTWQRSSWPKMQMTLQRLWLAQIFLESTLCNWSMIWSHLFESKIDGRRVRMRSDQRFDLLSSKDTKKMLYFLTNHSHELHNKKHRSENRKTRQQTSLVCRTPQENLAFLEKVQHASQSLFWCVWQRCNTKDQHLICNHWSRLDPSEILISSIDDAEL